MGNEVKQVSTVQSGNTNNVSEVQKAGTNSIQQTDIVPPVSDSNVPPRNIEETKNQRTTARFPVDKRSREACENYECTENSGSVVPGNVVEKITNTQKNILSDLKALPFRIVSELVAIVGASIKLGLLLGAGVAAAISNPVSLIITAGICLVGTIFLIRDLANAFNRAREILGLANQAKEEIEAAQENIETQKQAIDEANNAIEKLEKNLGKSNSANKDLQSKNVEFQSLIDKQRESLIASEALVEDIANRLSNYANIFQETAKQSLEEATKDISQTLETLGATQESVAKRIETLKNKVNAEFGNIDRLASEQRTILQEGLSEFKTLKEQGNPAAVKCLLNAISQTLSINEQISTCSENLHNTLKQDLDALSKAVTKRMQELSSKINTTKENLEAKEAEIENLEAQKSETLIKLKELEEKLGSTKNDNSDLSDLIREQQTLLANVQNGLVAAKNDREKLAEMLDKIGGDNETLNARVERMRVINKAIVENAKKAAAGENSNWLKAVLGGLLGGTVGGGAGAAVGVYVGEKVIPDVVAEKVEGVVQKVGGVVQQVGNNALETINPLKGLEFDFSDF